MDIVEKILEELKLMPESVHTEVLDFGISKIQMSRKEEDFEWTQFSLYFAIRRIEEEPSPYVIEDMKEKFS